MTVVAAQPRYAKLPHPRWRVPLLGDLFTFDDEAPSQSAANYAAKLGPIYEFTARGDGLFTAYNSEPNWHKAHTLLTPAFSQAAMRRYHSVMLDVAGSLTANWDARTGAETVDVSADTTRVTRETIGRCAAGYSFGVFGWPGRHHDLLEIMLAPGPDGSPELDEANIRYQLINFLVAGHETTSGALSFALYYLARHPEVFSRARAEVDQVWGQRQRPEFEHVAKLRYVRRALDESLRLQPTVPGYYRAAREDTVLAGVYPMRKGDWVLALVDTLHRDPRWGPPPTSSTRTASPPSRSKPARGISTNRSAPAKDPVSADNSRYTRRS